MTFADDTALLMANKSIDTLHSNVNKELDLIVKWLECNKSNLNINKTNCMFFQNRSVKHEIPPLYLPGKAISKVEHTRFKITWCAH